MFKPINKEKRFPPKVVLKIFAIIAFFYCVISSIAFAFRHPKMTDTERFLNFFDALLWR